MKSRRVTLALSVVCAKVEGPLLGYIRDMEVMQSNGDEARHRRLEPSS